VNLADLAYVLAFPASLEVRVPSADLCAYASRPRARGRPAGALVHMPQIRGGGLRDRGRDRLTLLRFMPSTSCALHATLGTPAVVAAGHVTASFAL